MKRIGLNFAAWMTAAWLIACCLTGRALAQSSEVVEIVPTARKAPATWRYTFDAPVIHDWTMPDFNDADWQTGRGGFGTPGTPGVSINTRWATRNIWMRREVTLPATLVPSAALQLLVFHDEDVEIYFDGVLAARQEGFVSDYEPMEIAPGARRLLKSGAKLLVAVRCRQTVGGQGIDVGIAEMSQRWLADRRIDRYRSFALSNSGDATNGRKLFSDEQRLACSRCHTIDGTSGRAGPDLFAVGDKLTRSDLIDAVVHPSANIAVGYSTTIVTTRHGDEFVGVLKEATDDHLGLMAGDGKLQRIALADVRARRTQATSLMPDGQEAALSPREFTDLIEYLSSLRLPAHG